MSVSDTPKIGGEEKKENPANGVARIRSVFCALLVATLLVFAANSRVSVFTCHAFSLFFFLCDASLEDRQKREKESPCKRFGARGLDAFYLDFCGSLLGYGNYWSLGACLMCDFPSHFVLEE